MRKPAEWKRKGWGMNPNPRKEAELREAIISQRIANCPKEIKERCRA